MKKQLLAAAVAATMTSVAMADISISGDAKFEYTSSETTGAAASYTGNTEVNLKIVGKAGDTTVVLNNEFNSSSAAGAGMDTEDMYIATKIGDVNVKAGNWSSSTSALLGEIDAGQRAQDKIDLSTNVGDFKIAYSVSEDTSLNTLNSDGAAVTVSGNIAGFNVAVKEQSDSYTGLGISGDVAGFGVRLEQKNSDTANSDVTFGNITKDVNGITLGYAWIDADAGALVTEGDSSIFAVEMSSEDDGTTPASGERAYTATGNKQVSLKTSVAGNTVTLKSGSVEKGLSATADLDYTQIDVKRALASGATLAVTYTDKDASTSTTTETFEIDLSVKF